VVSGAHPLTVDMLEESHLLIIGQTRSGKTYQLRGAIAQLRLAGRRVGAIDKLGNLWGLTVSADGTGPGLDFVIFGGKRAMVPMTPDQGALLGRLFVEKNIPAIFDISQWTADEQRAWVAGFAEAVFRFNEGALHLGVDEAQSWMPLNGGGPVFQNMLRLAEQGLGNGIRLMMSVQRLARLDATARGMTPLVIAMRQTSTVDRRAVAELMAIDSASAALLNRELPGLPPGTGWIWDPGNGGLVKYAFPPNLTFDSSRTPKHGDTPPAPIAVSSSLVEELKKALAAPAPAALPDDAIPDDAGAAYAKGDAVATMILDRDRRIAELVEENAQLCGDIHSRDFTIIRYAAALERIDETLESLRSDDPWQSYLQQDNASSGVTPDFGSATEWDLPPVAVAEGALSGANRVATPTAGGAPDLAQRGRKALLALAQIHPVGLSEPQWATLSGYARSGGTWKTYRSALSSAGLVDQNDGLWAATTAGLAAAGVSPAPLPRRGPERARFWGGLVPGARRITDILIKRWPHFTTAEALASDAGMVATGGTFKTYLSRMRTNGLLQEQNKRVRLSPTIMGDA